MKADCLSVVVALDVPKARLADVVEEGFRWGSIYHLMSIVTNSEVDYQLA